jgi:hypothetical protein
MEICKVYLSIKIIYNYLRFIFSSKISYLLQVKPFRIDEWWVQ